MSDIESHQVILKEEVEVKAHHFPVSLCSAKASGFNQHTIHKALDVICQIKSVCDKILDLLYYCFVHFHKHYLNICQSCH